MSVFRINKSKNYTTMSNYHFKDKDLSLKAKGLLSMMLSLPEDWDYSIVGLVSICKENETAIKNTLSELKNNYYLKITKLMPNETDNGRIKYIYDIYEQPYKKQEVENLGVENQPLLNTNNKKEINNNELLFTKKKTKFSKPTLEEVQNYCKERNNNIDAQYFIDYYESNGWKVGKNSMKDWRACIRTWERNNKTNNNSSNDNYHYEIIDGYNTLIWD